ncbi:hypothetical protein ACFPPD_23825 [Cohnella suwonensis]|uniref:Uncharacterized protein n=1 Tax=Cohnella suwonensis TaxID=696072 RepID=A0ABW0M429_9BACL
MRGILPAFANPAAQDNSIKQIAGLSDGSVTVDDLAKAFFDNRLGYVGERSLDETVKAIKEKADAAIVKDRNKKE